MDQCKNCGNTRNMPKEGKCPACGHSLNRDVTNAQIRVSTDTRLKADTTPDRQLQKPQHPLLEAL
jgi:uncharacterized OB-fold protein